MMIWQDGRRICTNVCKRKLGVEDLNEIRSRVMDEQSEENQYAERPPVSVFKGDRFLYSLSPAKPALPSSGGFIDVTLDGYNLTGSSWSSTAPVTIVTQSISSDGKTAVVRASVAGGAARGDYDLFMNGSLDPIRRGVFIVR
jgi:hypothetical protein